MRLRRKQLLLRIVEIQSDPSRLNEAGAEEIHRLWEQCKPHDEAREAASDEARQTEPTDPIHFGIDEETDWASAIGFVELVGPPVAVATHLLTSHRATAT